jgi:hypothetical protein
VFITLLAHALANFWFNVSRASHSTRRIAHCFWLATSYLTLRAGLLDAASIGTLSLLGLTVLGLSALGKVVMIGLDGFSLQPFGLPGSKHFWI